MSSVDTAPPDTGRECPRCGAAMAPEQDWCLSCGEPATTRVLPPPSWRAPVLVMLAVVALVGAITAIALSSLAGDAERDVSDEPRQGAATPAATQPAPSATTAPARTETVPGADEVTGAGVPLWPADQSAYTVVILTTPQRATAEQRARALVDGGADAGILETSRYETFEPGQWAVWRGRYEIAEKDKADAAAAKFSSAGEDVSVTLVRRRS